MRGSLEFPIHIPTEGFGSKKRFPRTALPVGRAVTIRHARFIVQDNRNNLLRLLRFRNKDR